MSTQLCVLHIICIDVLAMDESIYGKGGIGKVMTNELVLAEELRTELQLAFVSILV